jgi:hypothetical protein
MIFIGELLVCLAARHGGGCIPSVLAFGVSSRTSEYFGRINTRGFLNSPLVVVGKRLKLTATARSVMVWAG